MHADGECRGARIEAGVCGGDQLVARALTEGPEPKLESVGAGGDSDAVRHAEVRRELGLEAIVLLAEDEPPTLEDARDGAVELLSGSTYSASGIGDRDQHGVARPS